MRRFLNILILMLILILVNGCAKSNDIKQSSGSWAYDKTISLNGINYIVTSEEIKKVSSQIEKVKNYSMNESDFNKDNFSNYFKVGTKLYSIPNIVVKDAIAVEVEKNQFYKATNEVLLNK